MPTHRKSARRPLYARVRELLERRTGEARLKSGATLPGEDELARELGVSLQTARQALDEMDNRRSGSDVPPTDERISRQAEARLGITTSEVLLLRQARRRASKIERRRLQLDDGEQLLATERVRYRRGAPFMHEKAFLALSRLGGREIAGAGNYCLAELARQCGVGLGLAREGVTATRASSAVAKRLGIEPSAPLLRLDRVVFTDQGLPVEWRVGLGYAAGRASEPRGRKG